MWCVGRLRVVSWLVEGRGGGCCGSWRAGSGGDRGPAPGPRAGEVEADAAGGVRETLRLHPLPPSVEAGHERPGCAREPSDPLGSRLGGCGPWALSPCPSHVSRRCWGSPDTPPTARS